MYLISQSIIIIAMPRVIVVSCYPSCVLSSLSCVCPWAIRASSGWEFDERAPSPAVTQSQRQNATTDQSPSARSRLQRRGYPWRSPWRLHGGCHGLAQVEFPPLRRSQERPKKVPSPPRPSPQDQPSPKPWFWGAAGNSFAPPSASFALALWVSVSECVRACVCLAVYSVKR